MDFSNWKIITKGNRYLFGVMAIHFIYCIFLYFFSDFVHAYAGLFDLLYIFMIVNKDSALKKERRYASIIIFFSTWTFLMLILMHQTNSFSILNVINIILLLVIIGTALSLHLKRKHRDNSY